MSENNEIETLEVISETTTQEQLPPGEAVVNKTPQEMFEDWFKEEGNKSMLSELGNELRKKFGSQNDGWFDLQKMITFTKWKKIDECLQILNLLKLGGLLVAEIKGKKEVYKIVMNKDSKLRVLRNLLKIKQEEVQNLEKEILLLEDK